VFDADAADPGKRHPARERGRRIIGPRHQPRRHPLAHCLLARPRVEGENLHPAAVRPRARYPARRGGGGPCQCRIAVGLDLDLHRKVAGRPVQQHRRLIRRGPVTVTQAGIPQLAPHRSRAPSRATSYRWRATDRAAGPAARRRSGNVGLEAIGRTCERGLQRCS